MAFLELFHVSKGYGEGKNRTEVLHDINLTMKEGEFLAIIGFSGSGKTTLISLIAGLMAADEGDIVVKGKAVQGPGPDRGVVFQNYSLLPWLTVEGNVALAVDHLFKEWSKEERREHIRKFIQMVNLTPALEKRPAELSGGMRQRVSVARALAMNPGMLLLDEPLGALDALTRGTLQREIENIWSREKKTVILITNDVDESLLLADRVIPLNPGPKATLGPSFIVPFERPRDRTSLNTDPVFKRLRNDIIKYLLDVGSQRKSKTAEEIFNLPDLEPAEVF